MVQSCLISIWIGPSIFVSWEVNVEALSWSFLCTTSTSDILTLGWSMLINMGKSTISLWDPLRNEGFTILVDSRVQLKVVAQEASLERYTRLLSLPDDSRHRGRKAMGHGVLWFGSPRPFCTGHRPLVAFCLWYKRMIWFWFYGYFLVLSS